VLNKIDRHPGITAPSIMRDAQGHISRVQISARDGSGLELLKQAIAGHLSNEECQHRLRLPATASKLRSQLFDAGAVTSEDSAADGGWILNVSMDAGRLEHLCRRSGLEFALL
ncbi:MAG: hypothetical protein MI673_02225, partial [Thiotrichales bacterium]|nr:hypothetical protein [Thiotrichales bacterium]